jgi:nitrite reductase/ring-hydroxylating ferredoxin subunit
MNKKILSIILVAVFLTVSLLLAGCSKNGASAQGGTYPPTSVTTSMSADSVSIPVNAINTDKNVEFNVVFPQGTASYMAYSYNGKIQVRASVCVPCQGRSFTLKGNTLVCDTCGTVFNADTGKGLSGVAACQNYPKAAVTYTKGADGSITMAKTDLLTAFTNTLTPGLP